MDWALIIEYKNGARTVNRDSQSGIQDHMAVAPFIHLKLRLILETLHEFDPNPPIRTAYSANFHQFSRCDTSFSVLRVSLIHLCTTLAASPKSTQRPKEGYSVSEGKKTKLDFDDIRTINHSHQ